MTLHGLHQADELTPLGSTDEGAKPIVAEGITAATAMQATTTFLCPRATCQQVCANTCAANSRRRAPRRRVPLTSTSRREALRARVTRPRSLSEHWAVTMLTVPCHKGPRVERMGIDGVAARSWVAGVAPMPDCAFAVLLCRLPGRRLVLRVCPFVRGRALTADGGGLLCRPGAFTEFGHQHGLVSAAGRPKGSWIRARAPVLQPGSAVVALPRRLGAVQRMASARQ